MNLFTKRIRVTPSKRRMYLKNLTGHSQQMTQVNIKEKVLDLKITKLNINHVIK